MGESRYVHLEGCKILRETAAAFRVEYRGEEFWLPKSQVADAENYVDGDDDVTLSITEWIADQKGIVVED